VIERAVESLNDRVDLLILTGEGPGPSAALTPLMEPFDPLRYGEAPCPDFEIVAEDLRFTARSLLGRDPDLWHIHNHSLGKNSFTPRMVWHLARAGCRLLLQPHDFAEDGRPENYRLLSSHLKDDLGRILYPSADHVWYAPINYRDKSFLRAAGLQHVHELPNAVTAHPCKNAAASASKTIVYPARAIRRKNLGEFLLWSLLAPERYLFQSTLAPENPKWQSSYNDWVTFAEELELPVEFNAGRKHDFTELVQNAEALMTTSIAEGFGLAFLEPWLEGKSIIGRKLNEITVDFEEQGLDLSALYDALRVPIEWAGEEQFMHTLESLMKSSYDAYGRNWKAEYLAEARAALLADGKVDFGILDEELQRNVIRHLAEHPEDRSQLPPFNPNADMKLLDHNRVIVEEQYGVEAYGNRLLELYQQLSSTPVSAVESADADEMLNQFLRPGRFNLLRA
jgi:hypothetical protein